MVPTSVPLGSRFWKIREKLGPKMASHHTTPRVKSSNRRAAVLVWGRMAAQPNTTGDGDPFNAADSKSPLPSRQHGFVDKWEEGHLTRLRHEGSDPSCKIGTGGESGPPPPGSGGKGTPPHLDSGAVWVMVVENLTRETGRKCHFGQFFGKKLSKMQKGYSARSARRKNLTFSGGPGYPPPGSVRILLGTGGGGLDTPPGQEGGGGHPPTYPHTPSS